MGRGVGSKRTTSELETLERYEGIVRLHLSPVIGDIALTNLSPMDITDALSRLVENGRYTPTSELAKNDWC